MMDKLQGWWRGISPREQRLVAVGGCALLIGLCYWVIWQPVANRIDERQQGRKRFRFNHGFFARLAIRDEFY